MPDATAEALKAHLESMWTNTACPICTGADALYRPPSWTINDDEYVLVRASDIAREHVLGVPVGLITCSDCGYTFMVSTVAAGIRGESDD